MSEEFPKKFGNFYLLDKVGQGGMGEIYVSLSTSLDDAKGLYTIKKILPSFSKNKKFINQLLNEAKIAASLAHPNIVEIYDIGNVGDDFFIRMEFVSGKSLDNILEKISLANKFLPTDIALYIFNEIADAMHYAHHAKDKKGSKLNLIHGDLSCGNIIIGYDGTVKITDFGIAKTTNSKQFDMGGTTIGKLNYLSPEQLKGDSISQKTDIYSLGIVLYELLTNEKPFKERSIMQLQNSILTAPPKVIKRSNLDNPELEKICKKALAKEPGDRFSDILEFKKALNGEMPATDKKEGKSLTKNFLKEYFGADIQAEKNKYEKITGKLVDSLLKIKKTITGVEVKDGEKPTTEPQQKEPTELNLFSEDTHRMSGEDLKTLTEKPLKPNDDTTLEHHDLQTDRITKTEIREKRRSDDTERYSQEEIGILDEEETQKDEEFKKSHPGIDFSLTKTCKFHPENIAGEFCSECGTQICDKCQTQAEGTLACPNCAPSVAKRRSKKKSLFFKFFIVIIILGGAGTFIAYNYFHYKPLSFVGFRTIDIGVVQVVNENISEDFLSQIRDMPIAINNIERFYESEYKKYTGRKDKILNINLASPLQIKPTLEPKQGFFGLSNLISYLKSELNEINYKKYAGTIFVYYYESLKQLPNDYYGFRKEPFGVCFINKSEFSLGRASVKLGHEIAHLFGAQNKYNKNNTPMYPIGFINPYDKETTKKYAEIMGLKIPLSKNNFKNPPSLDEVKIGIKTAYEFGWISRNQMKNYYENLK